MCYARAVFCRHRGCYNIVGELILEPCDDAITSMDVTANLTTPIQRFRQLGDTQSNSGCGSEEADGGGGEREDEWLAVSQAYLFGCKHKDFVQRHRCGYRTCADCFRQDMMVSILKLVENGTGSGSTTQSLLARRQDLSLARQAGIPPYTSPGEVCQIPQEAGIQDPMWIGYPAVLGDDTVKTEDRELGINDIPLDCQESTGAVNDIYDSSLTQDDRYEGIPRQVHQELLYPSQAGVYHYQEQEPSVRPVSLPDTTTMFAIDPQLLDWQQDESQRLELLIQPGNVPSAAAPIKDPGSCVEDVRDVANVDVLGLDADVGMGEGEHEHEFSHLLEEALHCGDVENRMWNQDVIWDTNGYYS